MQTMQHRSPQNQQIKSQYLFRPHTSCWTAGLLAISTRVGIAVPTAP